MIKSSLLSRQILLMVLAAVCLGASFISERLFLLPWICFLPFLIALEGVSVKRAYFLGLLFGFLFCMIASFWIVAFLRRASDIHFVYAVALASIYWVYCAQQFAFLAAAVVWFAKFQLKSEWLSLALFSTLLFYAIPLIFSADLSVTQSKFLLALQAIDITGSLGLHFIILLHNGLLYIFIKNSGKKLKAAQYAALALVFMWFVYGASAYSYWSTEQQQWRSLNVGILQPNSESSKNVPIPTAGYSRAYPVEIELSLPLVREGAQLIIWPEARYRGFFNEPYVKDAFKHYVKTTGVPLLIQDLQNKDQQTFNTSALIDMENTQEYSKSLRIPFGEYLPLQNVPIVGSLIRKLFGDFYTPIAQGTMNEPMSFQKTQIQPLICFEVAHGYYVADLVRRAAVHNKHIQLLTVQSNDSWFDTSIEPRLHLATSQLRSLEQRLPLIHVLNNGPSSTFAASGQLINTLPANARSAAVINVAYPEYPALTFFSRFPYIFILTVLGFSITWILLSLKRRFYSSSVCC